jgi:hypothetical protein
LHSEYDDVVGISGDIHYGDEHHQYIPVSEYRCDDDSMLRHILTFLKFYNYAKIHYLS